MKTELEQNMDNVYAALDKAQKDQDDHNTKILSENDVTWDNIKEVLDEDGCEITGKIEVVEIPTGDDQHESRGVFKHVYVEQWTTGMEGDSFAGFEYLKLKNGKWLKIPYAC